MAWKFLFTDTSLMSGDYEDDNHLDNNNNNNTNTAKSVVDWLRIRVGEDQISVTFAYNFKNPKTKEFLKFLDETKLGQAIKVNEWSLVTTDLHAIKNLISAIDSVASFSDHDQYQLNGFLKNAQDKISYEKRKAELDKSTSYTKIFLTLNSEKNVFGTTTTIDADIEKITIPTKFLKQLVEDLDYIPSSLSSDSELLLSDDESDQMDCDYQSSSDSEIPLTLNKNSSAQEPESEEKESYRPKF